MTISHSTNAIRILTRVDADTLHIPGLAPLVGKDVEIIVLPRESNAPETAATEPFANPALSDAFEGFEESLTQWRAESWPAIADADERDKP